MTSRDEQEDPVRFAEQVATVCAIYEQAAEMHRRGIHVVCTDEKTGMQALERIHPTKPTRPGLVERVEFEYRRHGTLCLTANFEVATGKIIAPTIEETRTNYEFMGHISRTIASDPDGEWIFVVDNLDTHKSEALVRFIAQRIGFDGDLGEVFLHGILKSRATRTAFLADSAHRIRFVYTPRHCSWLNQVELWFSSLARRFLRRATFTSKADLADRLMAFIDHFNAVLAKPYRWTYTGRPLMA